MDNDVEKTEAAATVRGLIGRVFLACLSIVFALLALESSLRLLEISYPRTHQIDEFRGFAGIPNRQYWYKDEGGALVELNNAGFRDRDWSTQKPPDTLRIAVLGDSYAAAQQIGAESRFTEILERQLDRDKTLGDKKVEVLNFGVSGYSTAQEFLTLRHVVWNYDPDIIILAFLTGNDLGENVEAINRAPGSPYFTLSSGTLTLDTSFRESPGFIKTWKHRLVYAAADRSYLAQLVVRAEQLRRMPAQAALQERGSADTLGGEIGLSGRVYSAPLSPEWIEAWLVTEAILATMNDEVRARGKKFLLVSLSNAVQVDPDSEVSREYAMNLGVEDLFYPDRRLVAFGQERGFPVVALAPPLAEFAESDGIYLHGFENTQMGKGHWNRAGHSQAARLIGQKLNQLARTHWKGAF